jgi:hypothetical protein
VRRTSFIVFALLITVSASSARAVVTEFEEEREYKKKKAQVTKKSRLFWRNSLFTYTNAISAITLNPNAEPDYNPYWTMVFGFRPRIYPRDDLSLRANLDLEVEITQADDTDRPNELIVSDLTLDLNYAPRWMKIPVVDITVNPSFRLQFPTSKISRARTLVMAISPAVAFRRSFRLLSGKWLNNIGLAYSFRFTKYFHEYKNAQYINPNDVPVGSLLDPTRSDFYSLPGAPNASMRIFNGFSVLLSVYERLMFSVGATLVSELDYSLDAYTFTYEGGSIDFPATGMHFDPLYQVSVDLTYDILNWLAASFGATTFWHQLGPDGTTYQPIFNRNTILYLTMTLSTDKFYRQVVDWVSPEEGSGGGVAEPASAR